MIFTRLTLPDAMVIDVERRGDERGHLARVFCEREFAEHGLPVRWVQGSSIYTPQAGTLRGLHFQRAPHAEDKLVRCTRGGVFVVMVDLREDSPAYLQWAGFELTPENGRMLVVPKGFAQGYQTLVDECEVVYQMTHEYVPEAASGVRWDDPAFGIDWPPAERRIISERDLAWPDHVTRGPAPAPSPGRRPGSVQAV
jgi:dTDP-4-dehydrorhamnose 3,5-epimerase